MKQITEIISKCFSLDRKEKRVSAIIEQREERHEPEIGIVRMLNPRSELVQDVPDRHPVLNRQPLVPDAVRLSDLPH
jgi:hypothetical protein